MFCLASPPATKAKRSGQMATSSTSPKRRRCEYKVQPPIGVLFNCRQTSDIRLVLGERTLYAHRLVLTAASPVFRAMLSGDWLESGSDCVRLDETADQSASGEEEECFPDMLRFMYTGSVVLDTTERILELYRLSDKYGVSGLLQLCTSRIIELLRIAHAGVESPLATQDEFSTSQLCRLASLPDCRVSQLARYNLLVAIGNDLRRGRTDSALLHLPAGLHGLLECLLADDNLDAPEEAIFNGLISWLLQQRMMRQAASLLDRARILRLVACIRYPLMSPDQVYACECRLRDLLGDFPDAAEGAPQPAADTPAEVEISRLLAPAYRHLALRDCQRDFRQDGRCFRRRHPFDILASTVRPLVVLLTPCKMQEHSAAAPHASTAGSTTPTLAAAAAAAAAELPRGGAEHT